MKNLSLYLTLLFCLSLNISQAQTEVKKNMPFEGQTKLRLNFPFANDIVLKTWDKNEVQVVAIVSINNGEDDDIFALKSSSNSSSIRVEMDMEFWVEQTKDKRKRNCWNSDIQYTVYFPSELSIEAETISGNYSLDYYGKESHFKTISGDIDVTVNDNLGFDFEVKTISGEVYTDLDISYPNGKRGLRQVVGIDVKGQVNDGGEPLDMETISGNIFLRKG